MEALVIASVLGFSSSLPTAAAVNASVSAVASNQTINPGEQFTVNIEVAPNGAAIAGVQFDLSFDASLVTVDNITEGNLLSSSGASTYFNSGATDNEAGRISGVAGVIIIPGETVSTSGTFAIVTLTAGNEAGTCPLTLSNVVVGDINGQSIPASLVNDEVAISINRPPVLNSIGNKSVNEGQQLQFTVSATDPDGNSLVYSASNLPTGASFNSSSRTFSWTPTFTQSTVYYNIRFTVSDGSLSDSEYINITVVNVNRPPVLDPIGNKSVNEGQQLQFTVSATDPDGNSLVYSASNLPTGASFNSSSRTFSWTPTFTQSGIYYNVKLTSSDGSMSDSEYINITVVNANQAPIISPIGNKTVNEGQQLQFTVSATDPDGDSLEYSASNLPTGASFSPSSRFFNWLPRYDQAGTYTSVLFEADDGSLGNSESITITVNQEYDDWDANGDGLTNVLDMIVIGQHWSETGQTGWIREDANEDGIISVLDMVLVGQHLTG